MFPKHFLKFQKIFALIGKTLPKCSSDRVRCSFYRSGWKVFAHKVLGKFKQNLKNTFPKLLGWTHCRMQFWQPCWKSFAQRPDPDAFRAQSEKFSHNTYFGHVESNLDNTDEKFHLKLRKVLKKLHLNNVTSDLKKGVLAPLPMRELRKQFWQTSRKVFCLKPAKCSKDFLPENDPSDNNNWVLIIIRTINDQGSKVLRSDSKRKILKVIKWTRRKQFWQISRSFLAKTRKSVQNTISERFVRQVEKSFDKPTRNFLLGTRKSSAQSQKLFRQVFASIRSIQSMKHSANRSFKVRQKFIQRTVILWKIFLLNYSNVLVEWNLGTPTKNFSSRPKNMPAHSKNFLQKMFIRTSRIQNPQSTANLIQTLLFLKKLSRMWYRTCNLQFWWQCPITFGQNPKIFRINSDSLFGKNSSFYVECSFTENCRKFCPQSPKAYFAINFPCTREKKIFHVFRKLFAQKAKRIWW